MTPLIVRRSVGIGAAPAQVWAVLTRPELTRQYMYGCEIASAWQVGHPFLWKGSDGKVYVKGVLQAVEPAQHLAYTSFDPNSKLPDTPSNHVTTAYDLDRQGDGTVLTVTQGDFARVDDGAKRYEGARVGWDSVLPRIKQLSESLA